jgi:hypothetical protein
VKEDQPIEELVKAHRIPNIRPIIICSGSEIFFIVCI